MRIIVDTGIIQNLTAAQMITYGNKLKAAIPSLVAWSYNCLSGYLLLDYGEAQDTALNNLMTTAISGSTATKIISFEILGLTKEYVISKSVIK
jgi:hypothetical protein